MRPSKGTLRVNSSRDLKKAQRLFFSIINKPLTAQEKMRRHPRTEKLIKANELLSSHERIELYAQQYWWRLRQALEGDFACVREILGDKLFRQVVEDYLSKYPSKTFTLRNAGSKLASYLASRERREPRKFRSASEMAALEWALIESFDAADAAQLTAENLADPDLRLVAAPHVRLLRVKYPVHKIQAELSKEHLRKEASNTLSKPEFASSRKRSPAEEKGPLRYHLMIYRHGFSVYVKEISPTAFELLGHFRKPLSIQALQNPRNALSRLASKPGFQEAFSQFAQLSVLVSA